MSGMEYSDIAPMMGRLWSPIAAVTSHWRGRDNVQMAVAIAAASIVPDRPRVVVQLYKTNLSHDMVLSSGAFALNFLRPYQLDLIGEFGMVSGREKDKLEGLAKATGRSGSPLLTDCFGYLDCRVINAMDGGDMTCFLADVVDGKTLDEGEPLWWRDARRDLPKEWLERWESKQSSEIATSRATMDQISHTRWQPNA
jgi:flavin reductase (DIM6/NTAB) family NADH-FMN oxidoreductase RutF